MTGNKNFFDRATKVALVAYVIAIFISYALQCYVPVDILWNQYLKPKLQARGCKHLKLWEYVLRIALCFLTCEYILLYFCNNKYNSILITIGHPYKSLHLSMDAIEGTTDSKDISIIFMCKITVNISAIRERREANIKLQ